MSINCLFQLKSDRLGNLQLKMVNVPKTMSGHDQKVPKRRFSTRMVSWIAIRLQFNCILLKIPAVSLFFNWKCLWLQSDCNPEGNSIEISVNSEGNWSIKSNKLQLSFGQKNFEGPDLPAINCRSLGSLRWRTVFNWLNRVQSDWKLSQADANLVCVLSNLFTQICQGFKFSIWIELKSIRTWNSFIKLDKIENYVLRFSKVWKMSFCKNVTIVINWIFEKWYFQLFKLRNFMFYKKLFAKSFSNVITFEKFYATFCL